jgi:N-acetyl-beta-hexosaminidase
MSKSDWDKVYGGEFCFWGEHTSDCNLETVAWPRGAAALEVMWSPTSFTNSSSGRPGCTGCDGASSSSSRGRWGAASDSTTHHAAATAADGGCDDCHMVDRMREHGCRLKRRGLRPAPGNWGHCGGPSEDLYEGGHFQR